MLFQVIPRYSHFTRLLTHPSSPSTSLTPLLHSHPTPSPHSPLPPPHSLLPPILHYSVSLLTLFLFLFNVFLLLFGSFYHHPWNKHESHENREDDHQLNQLLIATISVLQLSVDTPSLLREGVSTLRLVMQ